MHSFCANALISISIWLGLYLVSCPAAESNDCYYRDGPLRGSLKSDSPLPLYDSAPEHLWNLLFAVFYIRPSKLPSRLVEYARADDQGGR